MKKVQVQGLHHITIVGSTKQSAVDFWQGALGMPFVMEQPNLGNPDENHPLKGFVDAYVMFRDL